MPGRPLALVSSAVLGAALLALVAVRTWNTWPPAVRYRLRRNQGAMQATTARYLGGTVSLDSAAAILAQLLQAQGELEWRVEDTVEGNSARMTALTVMFTPPGYSSTDPRIAEVAERTMSAGWAHRPMPKRKHRCGASATVLPGYTGQTNTRHLHARLEACRRLTSG